MPFLPGRFDGQIISALFAVMMVLACAVGAYRGVTLGCARSIIIRTKSRPDEARIENSSRNDHNHAPLSRRLGSNSVRLGSN